MITIELSDEEAGMVIKALGIHRASLLRKLDRIAANDHKSKAATSTEITIASDVLSNLMEIQDQARTP
jgi:hypothetical protein